MIPAMRPASPSDIDALVALEAAFPEDDRFSRRTWTRLLAGHTLVLVVEGEVGLSAAAVLLFRNNSTVARLYSLSVDPAHRGQGLARALLDCGESRSMDRGCDRLRLEVRVSNSAAIALYVSAGYRVFARIERYYPDGEPAARMEKLLT